MTLGKRLKFLRSQNQMSQDEVLAALKRYAINVNRVTLSRWENDHQIPTLAPVSALSEIYNSTLDYIIDGVGDSQTTLQKRMISVFRTLNETGQSRVIEYATDLHRSGRYAQETSSRKK